MFLKVLWQNKIKKVNFSVEFQQFNRFTELIQTITAIAPQDQNLSFIDVEEEHLQIKDALDFEYFLNVSPQANYKTVTVTSNSNPVNLPQMATGCFATHSSQIPSQSFSQQSVVVPDIPLQKINTEIRPFRQLATYRGLDEFVHHFDQALNLRVETPAKTSHTGVTCDVCQVKNMSGKRYKCLVCDNFDICENCEQKEAHPEHPMVRCNRSECSRVLGKLGRKFLKYKNRADRKSRVVRKLGQVNENYKMENLRNIVRHSVGPTFRRVINSLYEAEEVGNNQGVPAQEGQSVESEQVENLRNEKRELLRFMFVGAEKEVVEELIRRLDSLNLTEFCEEIDRNNRILDGF